MIPYDIAPDDSRWLLMAAGGSRWLLKLRWLPELLASKFIQEKYGISNQFEKSALSLSLSLSLLYIYIYASDSTTDHINKAPDVTTEAANLAFRARQADNSIMSIHRRIMTDTCVPFQSRTTNWPNRTESIWRRWNKNASHRFESNQIRAHQVRSNQIESDQFKPTQIKSNQTGHAESNRVNFNQFKTHQIEPNRIKSKWIK